MTLATGNTERVEVETFGEAVRRLRGPMSLRELARRTFIDPGHLSRVEAGQRPPTAHLAAVLDAALTADGMLTTLASATRQITVQRQPRGDDDLLPAPGPDPIGPPRRHNDFAAMMSLRMADRRVGGGYLYASVTAYLRETVAPRLFDVEDHGDQAKLFAAAAALTEMAGWMAHDAGRDRIAQRHFHRALGLARGSEDQQLGAHILGSLSHLAHHRGQPQQGLLHAREGQQLAGSSCHPALAARLLALEARGYAAVRQEDDTIRCVVMAEDTLSSSATVAASPWVSEFDQASLATEAARSFGQLGQFSAARRQAEQAVALRPVERARSRAFAHLLIATARLAEGQPDEACAVAGVVIDSTHNLGSYLVVEQLERLDQKLVPHQGDRVVATFRERLRDELRGRTWLSQWLPGEGSERRPSVSS